MRLTQEYSDKTAISLSALCLVHCLLAPSFLVFLSGYISLSYNNELIHYAILFIAIPVSLYALFTGVALNPVITPLRIVTALCADVLQGLLFFPGWLFH